jgi:hypothetical protein
MESTLSCAEMLKMAQAKPETLKMFGVDLSVVAMMKSETGVPFYFFAAEANNFQLLYELLKEIPPQSGLDFRDAKGRNVLFYALKNLNYHWAAEDKQENILGILCGRGKPQGLVASPFINEFGTHVLEVLVKRYNRNTESILPHFQNILSHSKVSPEIATNILILMKRSELWNPKDERIKKIICQLIERGGNPSIVHQYLHDNPALTTFLWKYFKLSKQKKVFGISQIIPLFRKGEIMGKRIFDLLRIRFLNENVFREHYLRQIDFNNCQE